jgi:hypothetical protein
MVDTAIFNNSIQVVTAPALPCFLKHRPGLFADLNTNLAVKQAFDPGEIPGNIFFLSFRVTRSYAPAHASRTGTCLLNFP